MKPIIILPPDMMADADIEKLRENGICVVVSKDPAAVRFVDPIPSQSSRTQIEDAAISLSRLILSGRWANYTSVSYLHRGDIARMWADIITQGTTLDPNYIPPATIIDQSRDAELVKIGREEARAAAAERRAAKKNPKT